MREPSWMRKMCPSQPRTGLAGVEVGGAGQCNQKWHIFLFCTCAVSTPGSEVDRCHLEFLAAPNGAYGGDNLRRAPNPGFEKEQVGAVAPPAGGVGVYPFCTVARSG